MPFEVQARSEETGLHFFESFEDADDYFLNTDPSVWKISYTDEDTQVRRRFIRHANENGVTGWMEKSIDDEIRVILDREHSNRQRRPTNEDSPIQLHEFGGLAVTVHEDVIKGGRNLVVEYDEEPAVLVIPYAHYLFLKDSLSTVLTETTALKEAAEEALRLRGNKNGQ